MKELMKIAGQMTEVFRYGDKGFVWGEISAQRRITNGDFYNVYYRFDYCIISFCG